MIWLSVQYLIIWYLNEIRFICINHIYLKFSTKFLITSINMIYMNEADFRNDTKRQDTAPRVTPFCHFALALKLLSSDRSQILRDTCNESVNNHKNPIDSQCNTMRVVGSTRKKVWVRSNLAYREGTLRTAGGGKYLTLKTGVKHAHTGAQFGSYTGCEGPIEVWRTIVVPHSQQLVLHTINWQRSGTHGRF